MENEKRKQKQADEEILAIKILLALVLIYSIFYMKKDLKIRENYALEYVEQARGVNP